MLSQELQDALLNKITDERVRELLKGPMQKISEVVRELKPTDPASVKLYLLQMLQESCRRIIQEQTAKLMHEATLENQRKKGEMEERAIGN